MRGERVILAEYIKVIFDKYGLISKTDLIKIFLEDLEFLEEIAQAAKETNHEQTH